MDLELNLTGYCLIHKTYEDVPGYLECKRCRHVFPNRQRFTDAWIGFARSQDENVSQEFVEGWTQAIEYLFQGDLLEASTVDTCPYCIHGWDAGRTSNPRP